MIERVSISFQKLLGLPGLRGQKGKEEDFKIDLPNLPSILGEPAQALPGFKGEMVSAYHLIDIIIIIMILFSLGRNGTPWSSWCCCK